MGQSIVGVIALLALKNLFGVFESNAGDALNAEQRVWSEKFIRATSAGNNLKLSG